MLHGRRPIEELIAEEPTLFDAAHYLCADLAREDAAETVAAELDRRGIDSLGRLVLNAGTGWVGAPARQTEQEIRDVVAVDLLAPMLICRRLLPLVERARGRIVFVSSVAAFLPCPEYAVYAASKAAAEGFFRALRVELEGRVEVQVLRPGAVRTGIHAKSGATPAEIGWEAFPDPESVAQQIDALLAGSPRWRTLGAANRVARGAGRNLAPLVDRAVMARRP